jgi:predicted MFS family arabinose efflux permease
VSSADSAGAARQSAGFSGYQKFVVGALAFLQFTIVLDFMLLAPLGAFVIPALNITTSQFGVVVSTYAFSAGVSGILTAGFADRFDRKKLLLYQRGFAATGLLSLGGFMLMPALPQPSDRGSYRSISSSLQQMAGGFAAVIAGLIVSQSADGKLLHFDALGYLLVCSTLITLALTYGIDRAVRGARSAPVLKTAAALK